MELSPMMQQYLNIKKEYKDCILMFRLGDFYEMFFDDAILASRELELTLTGRNCGRDEKAPMCGVPFHSVDSYIAKLVEKGYRIAICEQMEDPATAKGIVKREVIKIVTPGTVTSFNMLNEKDNNYLASIYKKEDRTALSYCDISTGEIKATFFSDTPSCETLINELVKINAKEVIVPGSLDEIIDIEELRKITGAYFNKLPHAYFNIDSAKQFVKGMDMEEEELIISTGALLSYLVETQKNDLSHMSRPSVYNIGSHMSLDKSAIRNLELTETLYEKNVKGSLLGTLDKTHTAMGGRKIKKWIREPLNRADEINRRLDAVSVLVSDMIIRNNIKEGLKKVYDIERLTGRIACGTANAKDVIALRNSIFPLPDIKEDLSSSEDHMLKDLSGRIADLKDLYRLIDNAVTEDPPFTVKDGGIIKEGYSDELDSLKASIKDAQIWIAGLENSERERTGIKNLRVRFNKVFGYFIEVTKSYLENVPEDYIRKQTLVNCERYITPELKETESLVLNAEARINALEYRLFCDLREKIKEYTQLLKDTADAVADIDVLVSFAEVSSDLGYVRPEVDEGMEISIKKGRHPVIEQMVRDGVFVENDLYINSDDSSMLLITGPNMSGKSTYMRQTALIVLMAQIGCFVPADSAKIGVVDRIFTRIGASDNLSQGQSTFYVEMSELSYILSSATERSLIILDEIGRGTSTYDGLSIAWAAVRYLCCEDRHIRTLFATHYHELTALENGLRGIKNLNVDVSETNGNIVFLHKIVPGSASRSYGIHVARLAGIPKSVLDDAEMKLSELESGSNYNKSIPKLNKCKATDDQDTAQLSFLSFEENKIIKKIKDLDLMEITPSKAILILEELQKLTREKI